jgi:hypothetical protein
VSSVCAPVLTWCWMNRIELTRRLARESHLSPARAADRVDGWVHMLLQNCKQMAASASLADSAESPKEKSEPTKEKL